MAERVYVALGSNLGDRAGHLAHARARLAALPRTRLVRASRVEETAPLGPIAQGPYLNQMVLLETELEPVELLRHLHAIEAERDRKSTRLNSSHLVISYAVFCLKKKKIRAQRTPGKRLNIKVTSVTKSC